MFSRIIAVMLAAVLALPTAVFAADNIDQAAERPSGKVASKVEQLEPMVGFLENVTINEDPSGTVEIRWDRPSTRALRSGL